MSFDGFYSHAMTEELSSFLVNGRIQKIYQPFDQELQFVIRANRKSLRLHASIHPNYYRLHLTDERPSNPMNAPMFCMLLRKHLESSAIIDIQQIENDRIIRFELSGRDDLGDKHTYYLIFELMGRLSNIILVNPETNRIIDCIKHIPPSMNSYRSLQPGADYIAPPRNDQQQNILQMSDEALVSFAMDNEESIKEKPTKVIQGLSTMSGKQILYWIDQGLTVSQALSRFKQLFQSPKAYIFYQQDKMNFYANDLTYIDGERQSYDSLSESLDVFFAEKVRYDRVKQITGNLIQRVKQIVDKDKSKLIKLDKDRQVAQAADSYRIKGELLNAYAYQIEKGLQQTELLNYYDNEMLKINLDPRKNAVENAQNYFRKYTKYRDSLKYIDQQVKITKAEIDYLETILIQIQQADLEDIVDITAELEQEGYINKKNKKKEKRAQSKSTPRRYRSTDGVIIYVGRNNKQNDELSMKKASKNHWWLHTKDIPGSHVIIESDQPSDQTMTEAAEIAAYHSKSQNSANVPVDTLQVKNLRKPNGAKPGYVIYEGQTTLYVTPDEGKIKKLEMKDN